MIHFDGLVQERRNSIANALTHRFTALNLPEGRSSDLTTAISTFLRETLTSLSKVNKTTGPRKKKWKNGGCTSLPAPCRIIRMKKIIYMWWVNQKARKLWRREYGVANTYMSIITTVNSTPVKPEISNICNKCTILSVICTRIKSFTFIV